MRAPTDVDCITSCPKEIYSPAHVKVSSLLFLRSSLQSLWCSPWACDASCTCISVHWLEHLASYWHTSASCSNFWASSNVIVVLVRLEGELGGVWNIDDWWIREQNSSSSEFGKIAKPNTWDSIQPRSRSNLDSQKYYWSWMSPMAFSHMGNWMGYHCWANFLAISHKLILNNIELD